MSFQLRVAIVGCGNIAAAYADHLKTYPNVRIVGFQDIARERAERFARECGARTYPSLDDVLADRDVEAVVNLTIHQAHFEVTARCLRAGKHVHTEKPLALTAAQAQELVALANERGVRLSSAPTTYLGEAQQTAARLVREGRAGPIRLIYAEINHGRIETWHPNPRPFYEIGAMWDVGVYPLAVVTSVCGPARRITALGRTLLAERRTKSGEAFTVSRPDFILSLIELESGAVMRLTTNFYHAGGKQGSAVEFVGDEGAVALGSSFLFDAAVGFAGYNQPFEAVLPPRKPFAGIEFGRGVRELADAIAENRPHRASGAHAAHVVEILEACGRSLASGAPIDVLSSFPPPDPMPWA